MFVLVPLILASAVTEPVAPTEGVEALCAQVAEKTLSALGEAPSFSLELSAEGPTIEIGDTLRKRCAARLSSETRKETRGSTERTVRLRVRHAPPDLVAVVEVLAADQNLLTE